MNSLRKSRFFSSQIGTRSFHLQTQKGKAHYVNKIPFFNNQSFFYLAKFGVFTGNEENVNVIKQIIRICFKIRCLVCHCFVKLLIKINILENYIPTICAFLQVNWYGNLNGVNRYAYVDR